VGARLRKARRAKGLTQEALALTAGLDRSFVSGTERGEHNISLLTLVKLAQVLQTSLSSLLENE